MLETLRRATVLPRLYIEGVACAAAALAFFWLLANGAIQPLAVLLLELYLAF